MKSGSPHTTSWSRARDNVDPFPGAFERRPVVDDEHDRAALEAFEAEDMAVEHLLGIPEAVPVGGVSGGLALLLLGVAGAGGQQRDVFGTPMAGPSPPRKRSVVAPGGCGSFTAKPR